MQPGAFAKAASVGLLVAVGGLGLFAYQEKSTGTKLADEKSQALAQLASCTQERDGEKTAREATEKTASAQAADLDASHAELEELRHAKEDLDKRLAVFKSMTEKFRKMIDSGRLQVVMRHGRMVVKLPASVLFPSGSAELSKDGQSALTEVAHILKQFPDRRFEVAGHTDNIPVVPPSPFKNNLELSTGRAVTVVSFLVGAGMSAAKLSAAGYSEYQPVATNAHEAGRQENRRIEIVLLPNLSEMPPLPGEEDAGARPAPEGPAADGGTHAAPPAK